MLEDEPPRKPGFGQISKLLARRKSIILCTALVIFTLSAYLAFALPDVYQSSMLLLITPQRLPASYVTSTLTQSAQERIYGITQQILSRTNLEKIIKEFKLYQAARWTMMEDRVQELRKKISISASADQAGVRRDAAQASAAFLLSFDAETPEKATLVTARLGSLFIDENIRIREQQAIGTTNFINTEAERIRKDLEQQEAEVNQFKATHRFELQEQLDANLKTIEQLRNQVENYTLRLAALRERKAFIEKQILDAETVQRVERYGSATDRQESTQPMSLEELKEELRFALSKYSDRHPEVLRLKKAIQVFESEAQAPDLAKKESAQRVLNPRTPAGQMLRRQLGDIEIEIHALEATLAAQRGEVASYQSRIDNTPLREIEFSKISRNYQITLKKYQDMLAKTLDSQLSENMEKQQQGEQFQILDPASVPQKPRFPNRPLLLLGGLFGGVGAGLVLAFLIENIDSSVKKGDIIPDLPILAMLPQVASRQRMLEKRRARGLLALASASSIAIGMIVISLSVSRLFY